MLTNQSQTNYTHFELTFFFFFFNYTKHLEKQNLILDLLIKSNESLDQLWTIWVQNNSFLGKQAEV